MRKVPECLNRRYQALDELIKELSTSLPDKGNLSANRDENTNDPGLKLMCDFWNILKEDPSCDLSHQVQQRMGLASHSSNVFRPRHVQCYMAGKPTRHDETDRTERRSAQCKSSCHGGNQPDPKVESKPNCCASKSVSPSDNSDVLPLSKVLCNLKDAASFDKKCYERINDLMATQKELKAQIQHLEHREQEGVEMLKQADCMWSCMEDAYKTKIAESLERQKILLKQLKEIEASTNKWRKNKKDLEFQLDNINKCHQEITEKINQKKNDIKYMDMEIADFNKKIENNKKETEAVKKSLGNKKKSSDFKMANIASEMTKLKQILSEEENHKFAKEEDGKKYVKEARDDLQKICRVLLHKKLENEDLLAEKDALLEEINLLHQTYDQCKDKCRNKQQTINDEILKLDKEIAEYKVKCIRCHQCTDTVDVRKFCTDCPKCMEERDCLYEDDHCNPDHTMDCVCMSVKQKFLDNVFENMYTVLERQTNTGAGKAVADAVLNCLKCSRNGKLDEETRRLLQDFILNTVKKNLNLTIVGGAVKTRCEMDPETYKQLMLCLNKVKVSSPPKEDKGTAAKKESCERWGGTSECNCPKGPKACICTKKAPPPPQDPTSCPPPEKDDVGPVVACPHKDSTACGPDCAMHAVPSCVGTDVAQRHPDPCREQSCVFSKNMRAAQCMLGPESLSSVPKFYTMPSSIPEISVLENLITCKCDNGSMKPCPCSEDRRSVPRERIIEEVMGRYVDVSPIDKVSASYHLPYPVLSSSKSADKDNLTKSTRSKLDCEIRCRLLYVSSARSEITYDREHSHKNLSSSKFSQTEEEKTGITLSKINKEVSILLCPKCKTAKNVDRKRLEDEELSLDSEDQNRGIVDELNLNCSKGNIDINVGATVDLLKQMIAPKDRVKMNSYNSSLEWISVGSLLREIEALTRKSTVSDSFITLCEEEVNIENLYILKGSRLENLIKLQAHMSNADSFHSTVDANIVDDINCCQLEQLNYVTKEFDEKALIVPQDNAKQLKTSKISYFDQCTCSSIHQNEKINDDFVKKIAETDVHIDPCVLCGPKNNNIPKLVPSIQLEIFNGNSREISKEKNQNKVHYIDKEDIIEIEPNEQFKVLIDNGIVQLCDEYVELKNTSSGTLVMELDENIINLIEKKMEEDPNLFAYLDKNFSGNIIINFDKKRDNTNDIGEISIKKTPSGTRLLKVHKEFVKTLKKATTPTSKNYYSPDGSKIFKGTPEMEASITINKVSTNKSDDLKPFFKIKGDEDTNIAIELQELYKSHTDTVLTLTVCDKNVSHDIKASLTRSLSGNIHVNIKDNIPNFIKNKEHEVVLKKLPSGALTLILDNSIQTNADLKCTRSGTVLIVLKSSQTKQKQDIKSLNEPTAPTKFVRIRISSKANTVIEPPVVLKPTLSSSYVLVVDKEYEKLFTKNVFDLISPNSKMYASFTTTPSGTYVINFDDIGTERCGENNACLIKTASGNIKIVVRDTTCDKLEQKKTSSPSASRGLSDLITGFPVSSCQMQKNLKNSKMIVIKSSSDSQLYDKVKFTLHDQESFPNEQPVNLRRTNSGKYAIVLNKDSKKAFVNKLKTYLSNSQGVVPIKRSESGEITIVLNDINDTKGRQYGSLKITPSGNIFITADETVVKDMKADHSNMSHADTKSNYITDFVNNRFNKAIATSCNAKPDGISCDPLVCVCKELIESQCLLINSSDRNCKCRIGSDEVIEELSMNNSDYCKSNHSNELSENNSRDATAPHIVIKALEPNKKAMDHCYYVMESVCPYHKDRYQNVSNEILEISGLCNKAQEKIQNDSIVNDIADWDSLKYLPPQLPPFLRDFCYR